MRGVTTWWQTKLAPALVLIVFACLAPVVSCGPVFSSMPRVPDYRVYTEGQFAFEYPAWPDDPARDADTPVSVVKGPLSVSLRVYPGAPQFALRLIREYARANPQVKTIAESSPQDPHPWIEHAVTSGQGSLRARTDYVYCEGKTYAITTAGPEASFEAARHVFQRVWNSARCGNALRLARLAMGQVGMVINPPGDDFGPTPYAAAVRQAGSAGVQVSQIYLAWGDLEQSSQHYDWSIADYLIGTSEVEGLDISLTIPLIQSASLGKLPADLAFRRFDEPVFQARFIAFVESLARRYAGRVRYLQIGHEIDVYLARHSDQVPGFLALFAAAREAAQAANPELQVGSVVAFLRAEQNKMLDLIPRLEGADFVAYTLYLCDQDWHFTRSPADVSAILDRLLAAAGDRPVLITETGWSTDPGLGGSENTQVEYVRQVLRALPGRRQRIVFVAWSALHDGLSGNCRRVAETLLPTDASSQSREAALKALSSFLCSLGLRYANGNPKPGWTAFQQEVREYLLTAGGH